MAQGKEYHDTGIIYRNTKPQVEGAKFSQYTGSLKATCCHCSKETSFWINADVKDGNRGKFFALRLKRMKDQTDAVVQPFVPRGTAGGGQRATAPNVQSPPAVRPAQAQAPKPAPAAQEDTSDSEFQY